MNLAPHPGARLGGAALGDLAGGPERGAVGLDRVPHRGDALAGARRAAHHPRRPSRARGAQQPERRQVIGPQAAGGIGELAVGLVDDDQVGELDDSLLEALHLVTAAGREQQQEHVDHVGHLGLGLADADRLDHDGAETRRLAHQHRLARAPRHPAARAARRRRADERRRVARQLAHARLVAEQGAARARAGGVDRQDGEPVATLDQVQAEGLDESRLAHPRRARDADAHRFAGPRQELGEQRPRPLLVVGAGRFDQGDGARQRPPVAADDAVGEGLGLGAGGAHGESFAARGASIHRAAAAARPSACIVASNRHLMEKINRPTQTDRKRWTRPERRT